MRPSSAQASFDQARAVFDLAAAKEAKLFAAKRLAAVEQDWTAYEVCERIKRFAREYESHPDVLGLIDALVERRWERLFYLNTLFLTDPDS